MAGGSRQQLTFDVAIATARVSENMKKCVANMKTSWNDFGKNLKNSKNILDVGNAFVNLGKGAKSALTSLINPYKAVIDETIQLGKAVRDVCKNFEEFEKSAFRATRAFKGGGVATNFQRHADHLKEATAGGMGNTAEAMGVLADARMRMPSLNSDEIDKSIELAKDLAAVMGTDYANALEKVTDLLGKEEVRIEDLQAAGLNLSMTEWKQIEALNGVYKQHERNILITQKLAEAHKGAADEEAKTLSGVFRRLGNMVENFKLKIGEMLAPIAKPLFQAGVALMNIVEGFVKPFIGIGEVIGKALSPLTNFLAKSGDAAQKIGKILAYITMFLARGMIIKGIMSIVSSLGMITGPIGLIIAALSVVITYWDEIVAGFKEGIGEERFEQLQEIISEIGQQLMDLGGQIMDWFSESGIMETVAESIQFTFEMIGSVFGWLVDTFKWAQDMIMKFAKWVCDVVNKVRNFFGYDDLFDLSAFDTDGAPDKNKSPKRQDNKKEDKEKHDDNNNWTDPRMKFSTSFESAGSMNQRIQASILSKSSPQVRMCDYLSSINEIVKVLKDGQEKQTENIKEGTKAQQQTANNTKGGAVATFS